MNGLHGIIPALITPFDKRDRVDEAALRRVIDYNLNKGVDGFYVGGSTGESLLMSKDERKSVLEITVDQVKGRAKIVAHIGCLYTGDSIELAEHACRLEVDAISSLPPFYYKFTLKEIVNYYLEIVGTVPLPMIIYNAPALTGFSFDSGNLDELFAHPLIAGIKFTSYDLYQMQRIIRKYPEKFIINGHDEIYLSGLSAGSRSAIGSTFNFMAEIFIQIREHFLQGRMDEASDLQSMANDIIQVLIEIGVFRGVKGMLNVLGLDCGTCRKPFAPLTAEEYEKLEFAAVFLN